TSEMAKGYSNMPRQVKAIKVAALTPHDAQRTRSFPVKPQEKRGWHHVKKPPAKVLFPTCFFAAAAPELPPATAPPWGFWVLLLNVLIFRRANTERTAHRGAHPGDDGKDRLGERVTVKTIIHERRGMPFSRGSSKPHLIRRLEADQFGLGKSRQ